MPRSRCATASRPCFCSATTWRPAPVKMLELAAALAPRGAPMTLLIDVNSPFFRGEYRAESYARAERDFARRLAPAGFRRCLATCFLSTSSSRVCQPRPVARKCASTSGERRMLTGRLRSVFGGRPRLGLSKCSAAPPNCSRNSSAAGRMPAKSEEIPVRRQPQDRARYRLYAAAQHARARGLGDRRRARPWLAD